VLLPGYIKEFSGWPDYSKNVAIYGRTVGGTKILCGNLADYSKTYKEVVCNLQANEIIIEKTVIEDIRFCGFGALASCDCSQSSFDPQFFTVPPTTTFASATSVTVKSSDTVQKFKFNLQQPDTVSTVCGNGDGIKSCGERELSFTDKLTSLPINTWPYKGYSFDPLNSELTLNPAEADANSVITVKISLISYPAAFYSQDITSVVDTCWTATIIDQVFSVALTTKALSGKSVTQPF